MQKKFFALPVAAIILGASVPAHAEAPSAQTQKFIEQAAIGNLFEIETSKAALLTSTDPAVKSFAQKMVTAHKAENKAFSDAVKQSGLTAAVVPTALDKEHKDDLAELKSKQGAEFNEDYIDEQADAHDDAVELFREYAKAGDNVVLKKFAAETLPTLEAHKAEIDGLDKTIN